MSQDRLTNAEADVLCYATRYALSRPETVAALTVVDEVVRKWDRLLPWHREQMQKEILETPNCRQIWHRVLKLTA